MATLTIELPEQVTQGQMMQTLESLGCDLRLARDGKNYMAVPKVRSARPALSVMLRQAKVFRQQYEKAGGYVIFFKGKPVAWKLCLDNPDGWEPGCFAIDELGNQWSAVGGDAHRGALRWDPVTDIASNVTRMSPRVRVVNQPGPGAA